MANVKSKRSKNNMFAGYYHCVEPKSFNKKRAQPEYMEDKLYTINSLYNQLYAFGEDADIRRRLNVLLKNYSGRS